MVVYINPPRAAASTAQVRAILKAFDLIGVTAIRCPTRILRAEPLEQPIDGGDWQPHDVGPGSVYPFNKPRGTALNSIRSSFAARLAAFHVPVDFIAAEGQEPYPGRDDLAQL